MSESIYRYVLDELIRSKGRWPELAKESGVSKRTIEKIASGEIEDPGVSHIEKLAAVFRGRAKRTSTQHV